MGSRHCRSTILCVCLAALALLLVGASAASALAGAPGARAASGDQLWQYSFNGALNTWDELIDAVPGPSGTMYAVGTVNDESDAGDSSLVMACFRQVSEGRTGALLWMRSWDNPAYDDHDNGQAITTDGSGDAIAAGTAFSGAGDLDWALVKRAPNGTLLWSATWGEPGAYDYAADVACDGAGNVYVCGSTDHWTNGTEHCVWHVAKFRASDGKLLWVSSVRGPRGVNTLQYPLAIVVDTAGYSYATGLSGSRTSESDMLVMKLTPGGELAWQRRVDDPAHKADHGVAIALYRGSVLVAGTYGDNDYCMAARYTTSGVSRWLKTWKPGGRASASASSMAVDRSGAVTVAGSAQWPTVKRAALVRWTFAGEQSWARTWPDPSGKPAHLASVAADTTGGVWAVGDNGSWQEPATDGIVVHYSRAGTLQWARTFGDSGGADWLNVARLWGTNMLFTAGATYTPTGFQDLSAVNWVR